MNDVSKNKNAIQWKGANKKDLAAVKRKCSGVERRIKNQLAMRLSLPKKVNSLDRIKEEKIVRLSDEN